MLKKRSILILAVLIMICLLLPTAEEPDHKETGEDHPQAQKGKTISAADPGL